MACSCNMHGSLPQSICLILQRQQLASVKQPCSHHITSTTSCTGSNAFTACSWPICTHQMTRQIPLLVNSGPHSIAAPAPHSIAAPAAPNLFPAPDSGDGKTYRHSACPDTPDEIRLRAGHSSSPKQLQHSPNQHNQQAMCPTS